MSKVGEGSRQKHQIASYLFRNGVSSKTELVSKLRISLPTVLQCVREMTDNGLILIDGAFESTGGRKAQMIRLRNEARFAAGVEITRDHIGLVLCGLRGEEIRHVRLTKRFEPSIAYQAELAQCVIGFLENAGVENNRMLGVGVSLPGILDEKELRLARSHALSVTDYDLTPLTQALPYACLFRNDADAAGLAESRCLSQRENMVYLSLSNSVGGAVFVRHQLFQGDHHRGGEFGHMVVAPEGDVCYCGKRGCLDAYCSALRLSEMYDGRLDTFFAALAAGETRAAAAWAIYTRYLAQACDMLRMAFDCPVVLGGYVGAYVEPWMDGIRTQAAKLNIFEGSGAYIHPCAYKQEASALGAALLHVERFLNDLY